jgi:hypothetical protein
LVDVPVAVEIAAVVLAFQTRFQVFEIVLIGVPVTIQVENREDIGERCLAELRVSVHLTLEIGPGAGQIIATTDYNYDGAKD